eukprot:TRINITY_DN4640_c0_g1_i1.p1 TRINITY_DN4640_c0_g1~~TRINITY_DN4640_c0_g1_i1.p1  ORF type:complete len:259 (+),score=78.17 TRINITY_DN4640_c0_g1_i1:122-898(+)
MAQKAEKFGKLFADGANYSKFRPTYPPVLFNKIKQFAGLKEGEKLKLSVDVGCGTGQVTTELASFSLKALGIDPSESQVKAAVVVDGVEYKVGTSSHWPVGDGEVDLVTVGQAAHWFDMQEFYQECVRALSPGGVVAIWCYSLCSVDNQQANDVILEYHTKTLASSWEKERALVDNGYTHISIPFARTERVQLEMTKTMAVEDLVNYLRTFSALKTYKERNPTLPDPTNEILARFQEIYNTNQVEVKWPIFLCLGQKV